ncbi:HupE/UreJ family protein [Elongatibacter sediminis]|uniref:HupE/UreJ family protein n=1 Tax=Elongatibacter sediminis TaxID=3119006 RepID=A0AAW9RB37_9GAMM
MKRGLCLLLLLLMAAQLAAHEVRPAFLRIQQIDTGSYTLMWRVPAQGERRLDIQVDLPEHCTRSGNPVAWVEGGIFVERWAADCPGGLAGHRVEIAGLASTVIDALARFERADGTTQIARLTPARPGFEVTDAASAGQVIRTYTVLGVEHILLGVDHLLFVLALLMLVPNTRTLIWTVTAFTGAHSITLAAATLGWVKAPQQPVEAIIALSILFVAMEIVHWRQGRPGITRRWPWLVAFVFGLLHGFGFAGALSEIGLPDHAIPLALLFFNLGVELGQLIFIAGVLVLWAGLKRIPWPHWAWRVPVYAIGSLAAFWTIERLAGF